MKYYTVMRLKSAICPSRCLVSDLRSQNSQTALSGLCIIDLDLVVLRVLAV